MQFTKKIIFNSTIKNIYSPDGRSLKLLSSSDNNKVLTKYSFTHPLLLRNNTLLLLKSTSNNLMSVFRKNTQALEKMFFLNNTLLEKLYMIGLGYKNFVLDGRLFVLVGDCNYIIFDIPPTVKIFCRKNQIYMLSVESSDALNLLNEIKKIKRPNFYKGKGVLEFKNFKFTKLKVGKKQRFM